MTLAAGTRLGPYELGPYEIVAPLGAGGMGEVYRATDSNLKRSVAIKPHVRIGVTVRPPVSPAGSLRRFA